MDGAALLRVVQRIRKVIQAPLVDEKEAVYRKILHASMQADVALMRPYVQLLFNHVTHA